MTVFVAKRSQIQFASQWAQTGKLNGHVEEMHTGHSIVKAFGRQEEAIARFDEENEGLFQASYRAQFLSGTIQPAMQFIANINYVLICVIGGIQVANGQMSLGDVQAFVQYSRQFTMPITQTASIANVIQSAVASAERVFELLDAGEEVPDTAVQALRGPVRGKVELEGVSFRYVPDAPLIEDLNLVVEPGQTIAIVGPTGAGKTTLVNLLMRFYEIDEGHIRVDGIDSRDMSRDELRSTFGMVLQDTWLFHGTIRENIAYGREDATEEEIVAAAQAAHVDHFVRTLPDGYDTILDDDATSVSQGEKQLLTIARAFLADRRILILDEATSSVDTRTEVLIQRAMNKLMLGRTSFVIAHRLSTIRDADTILVMDHGRIVEQGSHEAAAGQGRVLLRPLRQPVRGPARGSGLGSDRRSPNSGRGGTDLDPDDTRRDAERSEGSSIAVLDVEEQQVGACERRSRDHDVHECARPRLGHGCEDARRAGDAERRDVVESDPSDDQQWGPVAPGHRPGSGPRICDAHPHRQDPAGHSLRARFDGVGRPDGPGNADDQRAQEVLRRGIEGDPVCAVDRRDQAIEARFERHRDIDRETVRPAHGRLGRDHLAGRLGLDEVDHRWVPDRIGRLGSGTWRGRRERVVARARVRRPIGCQVDGRRGLVLAARRRSRTLIRTDRPTRSDPNGSRVGPRSEAGEGSPRSWGQSRTRGCRRPSHPPPTAPRTGRRASPARAHPAWAQGPQSMRPGCSHSSRRLAGCRPDVRRAGRSARGRTQRRARPDRA